eukprot:15343880-Ditylum_brightwellii.AAC.1
MSQKILSFPKEAQYSLELVACLGSVCEGLIHCLAGVKNLRMVNKNSIQSSTAYTENSALLKWIIFFVEEGLLTREGSKYKFAHDQIQVSAYSLIPEDEKKLWHLQIGNEISAQRKTTNIENALFIAASQLNRSQNIITEKGERIKVALLNLEAGEKAMSSSVFHLAASFFESGRNLLDEKCWDDNYRLSLKLYSYSSEVYYCIGNYNSMELVLGELFVHAKCFEDKFKAYHTQIQALGAQDHLYDSIKCGLFVLEKLGEPCDLFPSPQVIRSEYIKTKDMLGSKTEEEILGRRLIEDSQIEFAMRVASTILSCCNRVRSSVGSSLAFRLVQLSLRHGVCSYSAIGFASYGYFLSGVVGDYEGASSYGKLSLQLVEMFQAKELTAKVSALVYAGIEPWVEILQTSLKPLRDAHEIGMRYGDIQHACDCAMQYCSHAYQCGKELEKVEKEMKNYCGMMQEYKQVSSWKFVQVLRQVTLNLMGRSKDSMVLTGDAMDQEVILNDAIEREHWTIALMIYHHGSFLCYFFGNSELASQLAERAQIIMDKTLCSATFLVCNHAFLQGLISFELSRKTGEAKWKSIAKESIEKMEKWAKYVPSSCQHKLALLKAEYAFFLGQDTNAAKYFEMATEGSGKNGFIQDQALSYERAGIFYLARGDVSKASE